MWGAKQTRGTKREVQTAQMASGQRCHTRAESVSEMSSNQLFKKTPGEGNPTKYPSITTSKYYINSTSVNYQSAPIYSRVWINILKDTLVIHCMDKHPTHRPVHYYNHLIPQPTSLMAFVTLI